ncbi:MAG: DUF4139 domain-containing protein [Deltaproteobacteria bacterium]|nr:MAG: DUF4139 domain-containing protein [Deltaproteobacteria bacterium]TMQ17730.1 MAG: DUF4139 domain-containing protein [Deltaproteobacteria bacterium]
MELESRITEVTLYARGARVRRMATMVAAGPRVRITGLPVAVIDDTVRVEAEGGAVVTAVHVGTAAPAADEAAAEVVAEVRAARRRVALATAEVERLDAALANLAAAAVALELPALRDQPPPAWAAILEARRALVALRAERELALRDQAAAARRAAAEAQSALTAALDRERRAGSSRPARLHELRKHVDLEVEGTGGAILYLEYQVAAARWAPSYVARLDGERVLFEVRAAIAQTTGEDWTAVRLRLSTAEPEQFGALPELAAQRIGRRQPEPARAGFRAPPSGAAALYADYLQSFPGERALRVGDARVGVAAAMLDQAWDEETSRAKPVPMPPGAPPPPAPPMQFAAGVLPAAMSPQSAMRAKARVSELPRTAPAPAPGPASENPMLFGGLGGGGAARDAAGRIDAIAPASPPPRLDYANLRMAPPGSPQRGTLVPAPREPASPAADGAAAALRALHALALPPGCSASWPHTYDYAFATDGEVDVRSDGAWHSIAVTARPTTAKLRHVAVPREQADAFRLAAIANPLPGPLLPGPVDVYDRGKFLITSEVEQTPPGSDVEVGLGVDPAVKLARNTEFREETTGVLRGGLRLHHAIAIDIDNLSERAIDLEVRERVPVTREGDDDVDVVIGRSDPAWERWTPDADAPDQRRMRGGYRWRLAVPARTKRTLHAAYEVKIAGKLELVGGNRRES